MSRFPWFHTSWSVANDHEYRSFHFGRHRFVWMYKQTYSARIAARSVTAECRCLAEMAHMKPQHMAQLRDYISACLRDTEFGDRQ